MANNLMEKDSELAALRDEVQLLRTTGAQRPQVSRGISGLSCEDDMMEEEEHHEGDSINSPISLDDVDDDPRSHIFNFRKKIGAALGGSKRSQKSGPGEELLSVEDASALRAVNEMLRNELEDTRNELAETTQKLKDEIERGQRDLEAFAEALHGVDELRRSAEAMSRQLKQMKAQKKRRQAARQRGYQNQQDDDDVSVASMATHILDDASRNIRNMESQTKSNPIWGKINSISKRVMSSGMDDDASDFSGWDQGRKGGKSRGGGGGSRGGSNRVVRGGPGEKRMSAVDEDGDY